VEQALCRASDFQPSAGERPLGEEVLIFLPHEHGGFTDMKVSERFEVNRRYFVLLKPYATTDTLLAEYPLDPEKTYYRALDYAEGVLEIQAEPNAVVASATALCEAVRPANQFLKIDNLERLKSSPDLIMRENADVLLKIIRPPR